ncbi:MAG: pyridoxal-phosphate dependent enzyme [Pseudomonadales bacterium]|nr:pyridoxal-phosphate dependent enzyme [Pseudomonadales bacterium]
MAIYDSILDTIGHTPVVRLNNLAPRGVEIFVKVEARNPGGSVKDRMARAIIEAAEARGELRPGQTVVEASSGNTGIALAMVCAQKGYPLVVVMAENFSVERRRLMRMLGARVVLTPAAEKGSGMVAKAMELAEAHGWYLCRQFENEANARVHRETTAREIVVDFAGRRLDYWISGAGTGGTFAGVAQVLRAERPDTRIVVCEPDNAPVLASGVPQPAPVAGGWATSHPLFRPHPMQGISPDFIAPITGAGVAAGFADLIEPVNGGRALTAARALAAREGILAGISGGATVAAALSLAERAAPGSVMLCMLPDTGERYLSTPLFADIPADMDAAELEISRSTPGFRFDAPAVVVPAPAAAAQPAVVANVEAAVPDPEMASWVDAAIHDPGEPVVMFALEWCEFCWTAPRLFERLGIRFRSIDLDSVAYQAGERGARIRAVLKARTGSPTIPQVFVAGRLIGGATDLIEACRNGSLARELGQAGIAMPGCADFDPAALLPAWLHPRRTAA